MPEHVVACCRKIWKFCWVILTSRGPEERPGTGSLSVLPLCMVIKDCKGLAISPMKRVLGKVAPRRSVSGSMPVVTHAPLQAGMQSPSVAHKVSHHHSLPRPRQRCGAPRPQRRLVLCASTAPDLSSLGKHNKQQRCLSEGLRTFTLYCINHGDASPKARRTAPKNQHWATTVAKLHILRGQNEGHPGRQLQASARPTWAFAVAQRKRRKVQGACAHPRLQCDHAVDPKEPQGTALLVDMHTEATHHLPWYKLKARHCCDNWQCCQGSVKHQLANRKWYSQSAKEMAVPPTGFGGWRGWLFMLTESRQQKGTRLRHGVVECKCMQVTAFTRKAWP